MIVYVPIVSVRAFSIGQAVFLYLEKLASHDIALRILARMRTQLYRIIEPQAALLRSRFKTGDLLSVLADDIEHLQDLYLRTIFPSILGLTLFTIVAFVFGIFDIVFGIFIILTLAVIVCLIPFISFLKSKKHHDEIKTKRHSLYSQLTDAMFGLTDWLASWRQDIWQQTFLQTDKQLLHAEKQFQHMRVFRDMISQLVVGIVIVLTIIWTSIQTTNEVITPTLIAAFVLMMFAIADSLLPLSEAIEKIPSYTDSLNRMNDVKQKMDDFDHNVTADIPFSNNIQLAINNVIYQYPSSNENVLNDVSFTIDQ